MKGAQVLLRQLERFPNVLLPRLLIDAGLRRTGQQPRPKTQRDLGSAVGSCARREGCFPQTRGDGCKLRVSARLNLARQRDINLVRQRDTNNSIPTHARRE